MDNGEVITGLNETWTFVGATLFEWGSGFLIFMMASELVDKPGRSMPFLLTVLIVTTLSLAAARRSFPDEEVGLRNWLMVQFGIVPLNLPAPSLLQPFWSGAPAREMAEKSHFLKLGLERVFAEPVDEAESESAHSYERYVQPGTVDEVLTQQVAANE